MFKNYLIIGWRSLIKNKGYSYINILGLMVGMSVAGLIGLWISDEVSYDMHHKNYDRIAEVYVHKIVNNGVGKVLVQVVPVLCLIQL